MLNSAFLQNQMQTSTSLRNNLTQYIILQVCQVNLDLFTQEFSWHTFFETDIVKDAITIATICTIIIKQHNMSHCATQFPTQSDNNSVALLYDPRLHALLTKIRNLKL